MPKELTPQQAMAERQKAAFAAMTPEQRRARFKPRHEKVGAKESKPSRQVTQAEMIQSYSWIYQNMDNKSVSPASEPVPGAYAHLRALQAKSHEGRALRVKFYQTVTEMSSRAEITSTERFADDGRDVITTLKGLIAEFKAKQQQ